MYILQPLDSTALVTAVSTLSSEVIGNHSTEAEDAGPTKSQDCLGLGVCKCASGLLFLLPLLLLLIFGSESFLCSMESAVGNFPLPFGSSQTHRGDLESRVLIAHHYN